MRLGQFQIQGSRTKTKRQKHKKCKACGCGELIISGPDQFCTKCDWHSCIEYVEKGYMNNLHYAFCDHFKKASPPKKNAQNSNKESDTTNNSDSSQIKSA